MFKAESLTNLTKSSGLLEYSVFPFVHVSGCQNIKRPCVPFAKRSCTARLLTSIVRIMWGLGAWVAVSCSGCQSPAMCKRKRLCVRELRRTNSILRSLNQPFPRAPRDRTRPLTLSVWLRVLAMRRTRVRFHLSRYLTNAGPYPEAVESGLGKSTGRAQIT